VSLVSRALAVMGDNDTISSGQLLWKLDPNYLTTYGSRQKGGYHLSKALGVRPHHFYDPTKERWRSEYHRADLEAKLRGTTAPSLAVVPAEPAPVAAPPVPAPPVAVDDGITRCQCGAGNPWNDEPCWRCKEPL
jgi:hypothetical protein